MKTETISEREVRRELRDCHKCVGVFRDHASAEAAVRQLQREGFDMGKLSIVGRDYHTDEHVVGFYNAGDRVRYWGKLGAFWGGVPLVQKPFTPAQLAERVRMALDAPRVG